jgi:hypothetical protein
MEDVAEEVNWKQHANRMRDNRLPKYVYNPKRERCGKTKKWMERPILKFLNIKARS